MTLVITDITNKLKTNPDFDGHERVIMADDSETKFKAFIAVHNTARGPALGGCRYWSRYLNEDEAIKDVLRLSRGMTYKNALAELPLGGGKSVIVGQKGTRTPMPEMMRSLARAVEALQGTYITAEDVGMSVDHMLIARGVTRHVSGLPLEVIAGPYIPETLTADNMPKADPSPYTAYGVFEAMRAAVRHRLNIPFDKGQMSGLRVSVKGYGNVARTLCRLMADDGAVVTVSEIDEGRMAQAREDGFEILPRSVEIMSHQADIYAPCALGGDISDVGIQLLEKAGVQIVTGAANNQLAQIHHADELRSRGILYAPDYVANAGGVISVGIQQIWSETPARETFPTHDRIIRRVGRIRDVALEIFRRAEAENASTARLADIMARENFAPQSKVVSAAA